MVSLLAAFQFLSIFPTVVRRKFTAGELGRAVGYFPLVGLGLGLILVGLDSNLRLILAPQVVAVIVLAAWLVFSRGLHFDGFIDTCDGLFGGYTPERRLEIMRDSNVGAFGVAAGGLLLLAKYSLILSLSHLSALVLAPVMGRWVLTIAIFAFPYAREKGLGREMKDNVGRREVILGSLITVLLAVLLSGWTGFLALLVAGAMLWFGARFILRRIPGLTGDSYGALCEMVELVILIMFAIKIAN